MVLMAARGVVGSATEYPPVVVDSPYANTHPGVRYVGDAACIRCHAEIGQTYRQHPMGRSLAPIDAATTLGDNDSDGRVLFQAGGLDYSIEHRDGRVYHQETRRDASGRVIAPMRRRSSSCSAPVAREPAI